MGLKKKRAQMIGVVSTLAVASLVSVGFAAWTISAPQTQEDGASISADYTITDTSIGDLTYVTAESNKTICFGAPANANSGWLQNDGNNGTEDLTAKFVYTFSTGADRASAPTCSAIAWGTLPSGWTTAVTSGYVAELPAWDETPNSLPNSGTYAYYKVTGSSHSWTITIDIRLAWGTAFNNTNPYAYFNTLPANTTNFTAANTAITGLSGLNGITLPFTFTIS